MSKLPFVVEPRLKPIVEMVGSDESGKIEIERKGFLSTGEKAFVSNGSATDRTSELMLTLVRRAAGRFKIDSQEAYEIIAGLVTGSSDHKLSDKIREQYTTELGEIAMSAVSAQPRIAFIKAYCMLLYRVDASITADEAMKVHPDIMEGLVALYDDEEARSIERLLAETQEEAVNVEDTTKK